LAIEQINKTDPNDEALKENIKLAIIISIAMKKQIHLMAFDTKKKHDKC